MLDKAITIDEFKELCTPYHQYIVRVARRHSGQTEPWEIDNQVCECILYGSVTQKALMWFFDWDEGQADVYVLAYADIQTYFKEGAEYEKERFV